MSDLINRKQALDDVRSWVGMNWYEQHLMRNVVEWLEDSEKAIDDAYQRGVEDGKKSKEKGCEGCKYVLCGDTEDPCWHCRRCYKDKYEPTLHSDRIKVGDKVIVPFNSHVEPGELLSIVNGVCYIMWEDKTVSAYRIAGVRCVK